MVRKQGSGYPAALLGDENHLSRGMREGLMAQGRKPCIRCLLQDMDGGEEYRKLKKYLDSFDKEICVEDMEYHRRLELCRNCPDIREGICAKCGCFVEARALRKSGRCPHEEPRW